MTLRQALAVFMSLALLGCNSTGVGNPGRLELALVSDSEPEPDAPDPDEQIAADAVQHAVLVLAELRWLPCSSEEDDVVVPGPMLVDLVTGRVDPELPDVEVPEGGFCGLDAPLTPARAPASLTGRSLFFSGLRSDGTLFLVYADMACTLRLRAGSGVVWDTETAPSLIWAFRPRRWLGSSELDASDSAPLVQDRRVIVIDVDRHPRLYVAIQNRMGERSSLYADLNGNARLDPDERDTDNLLGQGLPCLE